MTSPQFSVSQSADAFKIHREALRVAVMIKLLPDLIVDTTQPPLVRQAAIESFYVNSRTLIEFLGVWEPHANAKKRDYTVTDVLTGWSHGLAQPDVDRLLQIWDDASKHLMHFSMPRRTEEERPTEAQLRAVAADVLVVWDKYAKDHKAAGGPVSPQSSDFGLVDLEWLLGQ